MSLTKNIAVCSWYDDGAKSYGDITKQINLKWANDQNAYYERITKDPPESESQTKYVFDIYTSEDPYTEFIENKKPHWNRIPMLKEYLYKKTGDEYDYQYVMWLDADACFRIDNSYKDLFESIVSKYECKDIIFSADRDEYFPFFAVFFAFFLIVVIMTIYYLYMPYNKLFFFSVISIFIIGMIILLIWGTVKYNNDWCLNSGVIIMKNTEYSRKIVNYWMSTDCYVKRIKPWQDQGCLRYCFVKNINNIRNKSVILEFGVLQRFQYTEKQESLAIHFTNKDKSKRVKLLNELKAKWNIN